MKDFYKNFCETTFDDKGVLSSYKPIIPDNFNFAYDVVDVYAARTPDKLALIWCDDSGREKRITYRELSEQSSRCANMLRSYGIKKGDFVLLVLKRNYQFWYAVLALHKLGAIGVPVTNQLTKKDYVYRFKQADVTAVISTSDESTAHIEEACKEYDGISVKFIVNGEKEGWISFDKEIDDYPAEIERVPVASSEPLLLYFTSGTAAYPKMVIHSHAYPLAHIITSKFWHNSDYDGLHLTVSETGWMKAVWGKLYGQMIVGTTIFVYDFDKFNPKKLLEMMKKYGVTTFCAPPTIYRFLIQEDPSLFELPSLRYATTAGEALNPEVFRRFKELTGIMIMEAFGQTETVVQTLNLPGTTPKPGSMGKPSPLFELSLLDEEGNTVPPGQTGEIVIKADINNPPIGMFCGYYKNEKLTQDAWHDGYYHTGDTAWRDEEGYFWYVGRNDDVIKASGYRISPFEIESVLMEHAAVLECAVTGAPDPIRGVVVKATVVLTKDFTPSDELAAELKTYVKKQTAPYKYPRIIEFVDALPKTISNKIRRVEIREKSKEKMNTEK